MSEDNDTRYYLDIDLASRRIIDWNSGPKDQLAVKLTGDSVHRTFLTKGQYHKLISRIDQSNETGRSQTGAKSSRRRSGHEKRP